MQGIQRCSKSKANDNQRIRAIQYNFAEREYDRMSSNDTFCASERFWRLTGNMGSSILDDCYTSLNKWIDFLSQFQYGYDKHVRFIRVVQHHIHLGSMDSFRFVLPGTKPDVRSRSSKSIKSIEYTAYAFSNLQNLMGLMNPACPSKIGHHTFGMTIVEETLSALEGPPVLRWTSVLPSLVMQLSSLHFVVPMSKLTCTEMRRDYPDSLQEERSFMQNAQRGSAG